MKSSRVRSHTRRGRPVRGHLRRASITESGNDVVIRIDKQDFDRVVHRMGVIERKIANAELHKLGIRTSI